MGAGPERRRTATAASVTSPHIIDRAKPGLIAVLADGKRFVNEADGYYDYTAAMVAAVPQGEEVASWLICDHPLPAPLRPLGVAKPFPLPLRPYLRSGYLKRATTIEGLAQACGIAPAGLPRPDGQRLQRAGAARRGSTVRSRLARRTTARWATRCTPAPTLAWRRSSTQPFHAVKVLPGSFGTFAGLKTNGSAQVLGADDQPIAGLYAVGTDMASVMGGFYPSGGINLGPAMTFGYIAGRHCAGVTDYENPVPVSRSDGV